MVVHVKKDDKVMVLSGKQAGYRGKVLRVFPAELKAVVEGANFVKRHTRPNPSKNIKGGIVEREAAIHISNLMVVCPECDKPTRVAHKEFDDGSRQRVCRKCDGILDAR